MSVDMSGAGLLRDFYGTFTGLLRDFYGTSAGIRGDSKLEIGNSFLQGQSTFCHRNGNISCQKKNFSQNKNISHKIIFPDFNFRGEFNTTSRNRSYREHVGKNKIKTFPIKTFFQTSISGGNSIQVYP